MQLLLPELFGPEKIVRAAKGNSIGARTDLKFESFHFVIIGSIHRAVTYSSGN